MVVSLPPAPPSNPAPPPETTTENRPTRLAVKMIMNKIKNALRDFLRALRNFNMASASLIKKDSADLGRHMASKSGCMGNTNSSGTGGRLTTARRVSSDRNGERGKKKFLTPLVAIC